MTLEQQYKRYTANNPDSLFTYDEWLKWHSDNLAKAFDNEKICKNCKYLLWMIGIGQGLRCGYNMKATFQVPSSQHTCNNFKPKDNEQGNRYIPH